MIQRLQTVLFFFALSVNLGMFFTPIWFVDNHETEKHATVYATSVFQSEFRDDRPANEYPWQDSSISFTQNPLHILLLVLIVGFAGLLFYTILQFKNRPFQIRLGYIAIGTLFLECLVMILFTRQVENMVGKEVSMEGSFVSQFQYGFFLPVVAVLLTFWGIMRVKKDEQLVKDSSRLR